MRESGKKWSCLPNLKGAFPGSWPVELKCTNEKLQFSRDICRANNNLTARLFASENFPIGKSERTKALAVSTYIFIWLNALFYFSFCLRFFFVFLLLGDYLLWFENKSAIEYRKSLICDPSNIH